MAKGEWPEITKLIERAVEILEGENPMTLRQLHYRLVSGGHIENSTAEYKRLSRVMTKAREDGRCDFDFMVDRSRPEYSPNVFDDVAGYAEVVRCGYRKDYWATQPNYCEVWVEKDATTGSIEVLMDELGVTVRPGGGFQSTTKVHEIATRFAGISKPVMVFYLGDHDPSGRCAETELHKRVRKYGSGPFTIKRLAIHGEDIRKFKLPPLRIKPTDSRAKNFLRKYGKQCVELDALPPTELRQRIRNAVEELLDRDLWNRAVQIEKVELHSIIETVSRWPRPEARP